MLLLILRLQWINCLASTPRSFTWRSLFAQGSTPLVSPRPCARSTDLERRALLAESTFATGTQLLYLTCTLPVLPITAFLDVAPSSALGLPSRHRTSNLFDASDSHRPCSKGRCFVFALIRSSNNIPLVQSLVLTLDHAFSIVALVLCEPFEGSPSPLSRGGGHALSYRGVCPPFPFQFAVFLHLCLYPLLPGRRSTSARSALRDAGFSRPASLWGSSSFLIAFDGVDHMLLFEDGCLFIFIFCPSRFSRSSQNYLSTSALPFEEPHVYVPDATALDPCCHTSPFLPPPSPLFDTLPTPSSPCLRPFATRALCPALHNTA